MEERGHSNLGQQNKKKGRMVDYIYIQRLRQPGSEGPHTQKGGHTQRTFYLSRVGQDQILVIQTEWWQS